MMVMVMVMVPEPAVEAVEAVYGPCAPYPEP
jgi:hypothetical protein